MLKPLAALSLIALAASCGGDVNAAQQQAPEQKQWGAAAPFVQHPENIQPGVALSRQFTNIVNPSDGNPQRASEGSRLFIAYNCMDCHGAEGSGAMGPSLQDGRWHFGGTNG